MSGVPDPRPGRRPGVLILGLYLFTLLLFSRTLRGPAQRLLGIGALVLATAVAAAQSRQRARGGQLQLKPGADPSASRDEIPPPEDLSEPPEDATRHPSGLITRLLQDGQGGDPATVVEHGAAAARKARHVGLARELDELARHLSAQPSLGADVGDADELELRRGERQGETQRVVHIGRHVRVQHDSMCAHAIPSFRMISASMKLVS